MNTKQAILKCNKKAWDEIKKIKNASTMMDIEHAIDNATFKTFGLWNKGLLLCGMRKLGQMVEFESMMRIRRANWDNHLATVRYHLIEMIPARFYNTLMYKRLTNQI